MEEGRGRSREIRVEGISWEFFVTTFVFIFSHLRPVRLISPWGGPRKPLARPIENSLNFLNLDLKKFFYSTLHSLLHTVLISDFGNNLYFLSQNYKMVQFSKLAVQILLAEVQFRVIFYIENRWLFARVSRLQKSCELFEKIFKIYTLGILKCSWIRILNNDISG